MRETRYGLVSIPSKAEQARLDREAAERRAKKKAERQAQIVSRQELEEAREHLRQDLGRLLYVALKKS